MSKNQRAPFLVFCMVAVLCGVVMAVTARGQGPLDSPVLRGDQPVADGVFLPSPLDGVRMLESADPEVATSGDEPGQAVREPAGGSALVAGGLPRTTASGGTSASGGTGAGRQAPSAAPSAAPTAPAVDRGVGGSGATPAGGTDTGGPSDQPGPLPSGGDSGEWTPAPPDVEEPGTSPGAPWTPPSTTPSTTPGKDAVNPALDGTPGTDEPGVGWTPAPPPGGADPTDPTVPEVPVLPTVPETPPIVCEPRIENAADDPAAEPVVPEETAPVVPDA